MKKKTVFKGAATALVTPFLNGEIDYGAFAALIEMQISANIGGLVIGGTTGEAATLSNTERYKLYSFAKEKINGRCPLILGTGTNDTKAALAHTKFAEELGCDGALIVTPYYNKGTEEGIARHYLTIAESCEVPIILYNVPSRTGVNLGLPILKRLAEHENIVALKEASDSTDRLVELSVLTDKLTLYAGNDTQIFPTLALGGQGVISVASNIYPVTVNKICELFFVGEYEESLELQQTLLPFIKSLFFETNPSPIKYALSINKAIAPEVRLPLFEPRESTKEALLANIYDLQKMGIMK